jgi:hypothetical protein
VVANRGGDVWTSLRGAFGDARGEVRLRFVGCQMLPEAEIDIARDSLVCSLALSNHRGH